MGASIASPLPCVGSRHASFRAPTCTNGQGVRVAPHPFAYSLNCKLLTRARSSSSPSSCCWIPSGSCRRSLQAFARLAIHPSLLRRCRWLYHRSPLADSRKTNSNCPPGSRHRRRHSQAAYLRNPERLSRSLHPPMLLRSDCLLALLLPASPWQLHPTKGSLLTPRSRPPTSLGLRPSECQFLT